MSVLDHLTTARVNGHSVVVHQGHRVGPDTELVSAGGADDGPVLVTVTAPVALTLDEVAAVLFARSRYQSLAELDDDEHLRELVTESVLNGGCLQIEEDRCDAVNAAADTEAAALLTYCRRRAVAVFAAAPGGGLVSTAAEVPEFVAWGAAAQSRVSGQAV